MKHIYIIIFIFFGQVIFAQNNKMSYEEFDYNRKSNQMHAVLDECFNYMLERGKEFAIRVRYTKSDTLFILKDNTMRDLYFMHNDSIIQDSKIVFIDNLNKFAKKKTKDYVYIIRGIGLVDNNLIIAFCTYSITKKRDRKTLKKVIWRGFSGTDYFYFQYSEQNNKWKMTDFKSTGI